MASFLKVGDTVVFNKHGLEVVFGFTAGLSSLRHKKMKITEIDDFSLTYPESIYCVQVDDEEINMYFLYDKMFNKVGEIS